MFHWNDNTLDNGLQVWSYPLETHSIALDLWVRAGSAYESPKQNGITHLLEHLHFRSLYEMTQQQLYETMESIGSTLHASTSKDFLHFSMKFRPEHLEDGLVIFRNILQTEHWCKVDFYREKNVVLNQICEVGNVKWNTFLCRNILAATNLVKPIMGTVATVSSLCEKQVSQYKKTIWNTENMVLLISGHIVSLELINQQLGQIPLQTGERLSYLGIPPDFCKRDCDFCKRDCKVSRHYGNGNYIDADLAFDVDMTHISPQEINVLNCILGEGVGSRLQCVVRETLILTTDISSYVERYEGFSILHIAFSLPKERFTACLSAIASVLNDVKKQITRKDLRTSLPFYHENLIFLLDDPEEMNFHKGYHSFILGDSSKDDILDISDNSMKRLQSIASQVFTVDNLCVTLYGPCRNIRKEIICELLFGI